VIPTPRPDKRDLLDLDVLRGETARRSLRDPVALATTVCGVIPDNWQAQLLRSTRDRIILNCARQVGKSTFMGLLALHMALFTHGSLTLMVAPSQRQSRELFRKTLSCWEQLLDWGKAQGLPYIGPELMEDNSLALAFDNGSRIIALPANATTIRGFSAVKLYIEDESAFVPDDLHRAVRPMLAVSKGRIVLASTPYGKRGHFYRIWEKEDDKGDEAWERIQITAAQCPRLPKAFLRAERAELGSWFDQEYGCQFLDLASQMFTDAQLEDAASDQVYPIFELPPGEREDDDEDGSAPPI
jgi:hypothetical protein